MDNLSIMLELLRRLIIECFVSHGWQRKPHHRGKKKCRNGVKDSLSLGSEGGYVKFGVVPLSRPPADSSHASHDSRFSFSHTFFFFWKNHTARGCLAQLQLETISCNDDLESDQICPLKNGLYEQVPGDAIGEFSIC